MFLTVVFNPIVINVDGSVQSAKELLFNSTQDTTYIRPVYLNDIEIGTVDIKEINFTEYMVRFSVNAESRWIFEQYNDCSLNYELYVKPNQEGKTDFVFRPRKHNFINIEVDNVIILGPSETSLKRLTERQLKLISEEVKFNYITDTKYLLVDINIFLNTCKIAIENHENIDADLFKKKLRIRATTKEYGETVFDTLLIEPETCKLSFTQALIALDEGKIVTREKWLTENIYLIKIPRDTWKVDFPFKSSKKHSHFIAKVANDFIIPWNINTDEIYVKDYIIIDKDKIN